MPGKWACVLAWAALAAPAAGAGDDAARRMVDETAGAHLLRDRRAPARSGPPAPRAAPAAGGGVLWSRNLTDAIFTTTGISIAERALVAGTWLNPPRETGRYPLEGPGVPLWTFDGTRFEVAAGHGTDVLAAVDAGADQTITVYRWRAASGVPDWSFTIPQAALGTHRTVALSPDGSTIAVLVNDQSGEQAHAKLLVFDAGSPVPVSVFDAGDGAFGRNLAVSADGAYVAFIGAATVFVVDRDANALRQSFSAGASNDPIAISGDGNIVAYGWRTLFVRQWNGTQYISLWTQSGGGEVLRACEISADGSTMVTAWTPSSFDRNRVELYELPSSVPRWTHLYARGSGSFQDVVNDLAVTPTGSHFAAASWGDQANSNPEVNVFEHAQPDPVLAVDTPGSMFDVDVARAPGGVIHISAGGKHIHANQSGRGGDLYSIRLLTACTADVDGDGAVGFADLLGVLAAWGPYDPCPPFIAEDIDRDCTVGFSDLLAVLAGWGPC